MEKRFLQIFIFIVVSAPSALAQQKDIIDSLLGYLRASDAKNIAANFSSSVELNILGDENTYSKAQAEQVIRNFLTRNKPLNVRLVHRLTSNPAYRLAVFSVKTDSDSFRVTISLSSSGEHFLIREMRIESDKQ